jgi:hypothetical protein
VVNVSTTWKTIKTTLILKGRHCLQPILPLSEVQWILIGKFKFLLEFQLGFFCKVWTTWTLTFVIYQLYEQLYSDVHQFNSWQCFPWKIFFSSPPVEKIAKAEFIQMFIQFHGCIYLAQGRLLNSALEWRSNCSICSHCFMTTVIWVITWW